MTADGGDRFLGAPRFDVVLRGYDRRQVDEHIARLQRVIQRLRADLEISRSQPQQQAPPATPGRGFRGPTTPERGMRQQPEWGQRPPQQPAPDVVGGFTDRMQSILRAAEEEAAEIRRRARMDAAGGEHLRAQVAELAGQRDAMLAELNRLRGRLDGDVAPREDGRPGEPPRPRPRPAPGPRPVGRTAAVPLEPGPPGPDGAPAPDARPAPAPRPPLAGESAAGADAAQSAPPGPAVASHERTTLTPGVSPSPRPRPSPVPRPTAPHPTAVQPPAAQQGTAGQPLPGTSRPGAPAHSADHSGTVWMPARAEQAEADEVVESAGDGSVERTVVVSAVRPNQVKASGADERADERADDAGKPAGAGSAPETEAGDADDPAGAADTVVTPAVRRAGDGEDDSDADGTSNNGHHGADRATSAFRPG